jgi:hypothetical protein
MLHLAEMLGWPEGVTGDCDAAGVRIPSGGETWWRALAAEIAITGDGDETIMLRATLEWAALMRIKGADPGPPQGWEERATLSLEAEDGMAIEADDDADGDNSSEPSLDAVRARLLRCLARRS